MDYEIIDYRVSWNHGLQFKTFHVEEDALKFAQEKRKEASDVRIIKRLKAVGW